MEWWRGGYLSFEARHGKAPAASQLQFWPAGEVSGHGSGRSSGLGPASQRRGGERRLLWGKEEEERRGGIYRVPARVRGELDDPRHPCHERDMWR